MQNICTKCLQNEKHRSKALRQTVCCTKRSISQLNPSSNANKLHGKLIACKSSITPTQNRVERRLSKGPQNLELRFSGEFETGQRNNRARRARHYTRQDTAKRDEQIEHTAISNTRAARHEQHGQEQLRSSIAVAAAQNAHTRAAHTGEERFGAQERGRRGILETGWRGSSEQDTKER